MTTYITTFDLPTIHRHAIGFDRIIGELNRTFANSKGDNYPPHNVIQLEDNKYVIEVAVAGFAESELDVELKENLLTIRGEQEKKDNERQYLHRGISSRNFTKTFPLGESIEVRGATVQNGILSINLEQVIPEEKQAKKIAITFAK
jgi:molecular chaperone IbpA